MDCRCQPKYRHTEQPPARSHSRLRERRLGCGFYLNSTGAVRTLTMYWNGTHWAIGTSANANSTVNQLIGVTALSATNVWAVGYYFTSHDVKQTLIDHWNGSKWSVVSSPNASTGDN